MSNHAKLSPSNHRWLVRPDMPGVPGCPGSIRLSASIPPKPSNIYAMEGTAAHTLGERCLHIGIDAADKIGSKIEVRDNPFPSRVFEVTEEMAAAVQVYLNEIRRKRNLITNGIFKIEKRLDLSWLVPDLFGTGDHIAIEPGKRVCVDDYKNGFNIVEPEDNSQFMIYGLAAMGKGNPHKVSIVELTVIQPNAPHTDGPVRGVLYSAEYLTQWGHEVLFPGAKLALSEDAYLKAGEWCKWCPALAPDVSIGWLGCPEAAERVTKVAADMFSNKALPVTLPAKLDLTEVSGEKLSRLIELIGMIQEIAEGARAEAYIRLEQGHSEAPKNFKLVAGQGSRSWKDETQIKTFVSKFKGVQSTTEPKLKSVAQMEMAFKKANLDEKTLTDFIHKTRGKPSMVSISDKRKALGSSIEQIFGPAPSNDPLA